MKDYRYYSQYGEDFLLWNFFEYKKTGFYVDVGSFDGVHLSNTFSFEQQGWTGICVEPHPTYFPLCQQSRPKSICLNVACVGDEETQTIDFYAEDLGLLSGIQSDRDADVRSRYEKRGLTFDGFERIAVKASTLNAILYQFLPAKTEIDFVSVDVEGTELEVLKGLDLSRFRPRVLVVESHSENARIALYDYLVEMNGYIEARDLGLNIFYTREVEDARRISNIAIDCDIERNLHPRGEIYTIKQFINGKSIRQRCKSDVEHNATKMKLLFAARVIRGYLSRIKKRLS